MRIQTLVGQANRFMPPSPWTSGLLNDYIGPDEGERETLTVNVDIAAQNWEEAAQAAQEEDCCDADGPSERFMG